MRFVQLEKDYYKAEFEEAEKATEKEVEEVEAVIGEAQNEHKVLEIFAKGADAPREKAHPISMPWAPDVSCGSRLTIWCFFARSRLSTTGKSSINASARAFRGLQGSAVILSWGLFPGFCGSLAEAVLLHHIVHV